MSRFNLLSHLSIRTRLLVVFMTLFTVAFATAFAWFYQYTTNLVIEELRQNMMASAASAASLIDPVEHTQVFESGVEGDAQYTHIADQLRMIQDANPMLASIYTMVLSPNPNEALFVVSADENYEERAHLREPYDITDIWELVQGFEEPYADTAMGSDRFGTWLSGYAPIRDASGKGIAIVGVDVSAEDVLDAQAQVRYASALGFLVAYLGVFSAAYLISGSITRSIHAIANAAGQLERGEPFDQNALEQVGRGGDEVSRLARVFSQMAVQVQAREQKLKQEVIALRIEIDEVKRARQVEEITSTDYFQNVQSRAQEMRRRRETKSPTSETGEDQPSTPA